MKKLTIVFLILGTLITITCNETHTKDLYSNGCNAGRWNDCVSLGKMYAEADGVQQDKKKAKELFKKACDKHAGRGCFRLALMYIDGIEVKQDNTKAVKLLSKACGNSEPAESCYKLGTMNFRGVGIKQNKLEAVFYYERSCWAGFSKGCFDAGFLYDKNLGKEKDIIQSRMKAIRLFSHACELGQEKGCSLVQEKLAFFSKSCKDGDTEYCNGLGSMYYFPGTGVKNNQSKALEIYKRSCTNGNSESCINAGKYHYENIRGETGIDEEHRTVAIDFFSKACNLKNNKGCQYVGDIYASIGSFSENNKRQAIKFYKKSCDLRNRMSCGRLKKLKNNESLRDTR